VNAIDLRAREVDARSNYEALVEFLYLAPVGIIKFRSCGRIEMANPVASQLLMPLARGAKMSNLYDLLADVVPDLRDRIERFIAPSGRICHQMQIQGRPAGVILTLDINKIDADTFMAIVQDISLAVAQEERLRTDQVRFQAIFDNIRDYAIYTVDPNGRLDGWNRSLNRLGGWEAADVTGKPLDALYPEAPGGVSSTASLLERARQHGSAEFEGWCVRKDERRFWGSTVATVLPDREGRPCGYVLVTRDLTERKRVEDRLLMLSTKDPLTGALNRRGGEEALASAFQAWQRLHQAFAVLLLDVDHFKSVNDRWGHDVGDEVLKTIVRIGQENLRGFDLIARWGGEEFVVILPNTSGQIAAAVAERIRAAVEASATPTSEGVIRVTISIGIAGPSSRDDRGSNVVSRADRALYVAKNEGRNRVIVG
jgi:diguanylate cyclase (GGDEF)-like protein/PAS domain S-box-containing protein